MDHKIIDLRIWQLRADLQNNNVVYHYKVGVGSRGWIKDEMQVFPVYSFLRCCTEGGSGGPPKKNRLTTKYAGEAI